MEEEFKNGSFKCKIAELEAQILKEQKELEEKRNKRKLETSFKDDLTYSDFGATRNDDLTYSEFSATKNSYLPLGKDKIDEM